MAAVEQSYIFHGFDSEGAQQLLDEVLDSDHPAAILAREKILHQYGVDVYYSPPGLPLCWKCTLKHVGQAVGYAAELEAYPERIACVVGELGHAYRECPDRELSEKIRQTYQDILDTGCIPDFTPLLRDVVQGWQDSL